VIALGLDPSLTGFGWAIHDSSKHGPERVVARGVFTTGAKDIFITRYMRLREEAFTILKSYPQVLRVGVESPPFGEQFSEGLYGLFLFVVEAIYSSRRDVVFFDPGTVKFQAKMDASVRRGSMDKRDMIEAAKVDSSVTKWNHNEADAYLIARSAARFWEYMDGALLEQDLTPSEVSSFLRVHTFKRGPRAGRVHRTGLAYRENDRFFRFTLERNEEEKHGT